MAVFDWSKLSGGPPAPAEPEVTVIGPGYGESIVVHVGGGRWMLVDSCIDSQAERGKPAAISYLEAIKVDPAAHVDLVVATHWHQDHVRGLAEVVRRCPNARFACGAALLREELVAYLFAIGPHLTTLSAPKPHELVETLRNLRGRDLHPRPAKAGQLLFPWPALGCQAMALSPSDAEYGDFMAGIPTLFPRHGEPRRADTPRDPNEACVVVQVRWSDFSVLLGGDMVVTGARDRGWSAVMKEHSEQALPKSSVIKIPHHGSHNAHYEPMWRDGLEPSPVAIVTPFGRGPKATRPPTRADVERIAALSSRAYLTSAGGGATPRLEAAVERTLAEGGIELSDASAPLGLVRLRRSAGAWREQLFPPATVVPRR